MPRKLTGVIHVPTEIAKVLTSGDAFDATFEGAHYAKAASVVSVEIEVDDAGSAPEHAAVTFEITGKLRTAVAKQFPSGGLSGVSIGPLA